MKAANGDGLPGPELEEFANCRALCVSSALFKNYDGIEDESVSESDRVILAIGVYFSHAEAAQLHNDAKKRAAMKTMQSKRIVMPS